MREHQAIISSHDIDAIEVLFILYWDELYARDHGYLGHIGLDKKIKQQNSAFVQHVFSTRWHSTDLNDFRDKDSAVFSIRRDAEGNIKIKLEEIRWPKGTPKDLMSYKPIVDENFWQEIFSEIIDLLEKEGFRQVDISAEEKQDPDKPSKTNNRAKLFKRIKEQYPRSTQSIVATKATRTEYDALKKKLTIQKPSIDASSLESEARSMFIEKWGKPNFEEHDVRNDYVRFEWPWKKGERNR